MEKIKNKIRTIKEIAEIELVKHQLTMLQQRIRSGEVDLTIAKTQTKLTQQLINDLYGKRNIFGDEVHVSDYAIAYYGTPNMPKNKREILIASKGHIVNQGLIALVNLLGCYTLSGGLNAGLPSGGSNILTQNWASKVQCMRVGTGTAVTTSTTSDLTAPDTTAPSAQSGELSSPPSGGYRVAWLSTWNSGTLSAITVREIGLFLALDTTLRSFGGSYTSSNTKLFSRLSSADGDFTAFTVNTSVPLTIEWRLTLTFA